MATVPYRTPANKPGVALRLDRLEADLITEIHTWARRFDARQEAIEILVNSFDERLGDLENQVAELRHRLE